MTMNLPYPDFAVCEGARPLDNAEPYHMVRDSVDDWGTAQTWEEAALPCPKGFVKSWLHVSKNGEQYYLHGGKVWRGEDVLFARVSVIDAYEK